MLVLSEHQNCCLFEDHQKIITTTTYMNSCLAGESPPETALSALIRRLALRFEFHEFLEADHVEKRSAIC